MLKITVDEQGTKTLFILEGSLTESWVSELYKTIESRLTIAELICLELSNVHYVNEQGLSLLKDLTNWGITLENVSPYINELLKTELLVDLALTISAE